MKNKKWLAYTLGGLLSLIVLAVAGGIGFRAGMIKSASFVNLTDGQTTQAPFFAHSHGMEGDFNRMDHGDFPRDFDRGGFRSPLFGIFHLIAAAGLAFIGYKLIKNSGWRLVNVNASTAPTPAMETPAEIKAGDGKKAAE